MVQRQQVAPDRRRLTNVGHHVPVHHPVAQIREVVFPALERTPRFGAEADTAVPAVDLTHPAVKLWASLPVSLKDVEHQCRATEIEVSDSRETVLNHCADEPHAA